MYPGVLIKAQNGEYPNDNVQLAVPIESFMPYSIDFQTRKYRRVPWTLQVKKVPFS
jgi:hypothetical protein